MFYFRSHYFTSLQEERHKPQLSLPIALLLATGKWNVSSAEQALREEPRVCTLLNALHANRFPSRILGMSTDPSTNYVCGVDLGGTWVRGAAVGIDDDNYGR